MGQSPGGQCSRVRGGRLSCSDMDRGALLWSPPSGRNLNRNGGRHQIGIPDRLASESTNIHGYGRARLREKTDKSCAVSGGAARLHLLEQRRVTRQALVVGHHQRKMDRAGDLVDIERVNQESLGELVGGARKAGEDQHAGDAGFWAATYSLATKFMPSRNGVTRPIRATR